MKDYNRKIQMIKPKGIHDKYQLGCKEGQPMVIGWIMMNVTLLVSLCSMLFSIQRLIFNQQVGNLVDT